MKTALMFDSWTIRHGADMAESTPANVAHLLRRAAFGGRPEEIDALVGRDLGGIVDELYDTSRAPDAGEPPRFDTGFEAYAPEALQLWWFRLAATSATPAIERLNWFWQGHFATSDVKVESSYLMHRQFVTLRRIGLGRIEDLLLAMTLDPAMNVWLDLHLSEVGAPNENYARELMELFSMGADNGYSQQDVVEVGRSLTGYRLDERAPTYVVRDVRLLPEFHDYTDKTVLGRTGNWSADDVVAIIAARPETSTFIARRLWLRYAGTTGSERVIGRMAGALRDGTVFDALKVMLTDDEFYSDEVKQGLVVQPVELVVRVARNFALPVTRLSLDDLRLDYDSEWPEHVETAMYMVWWCDRMGQRVAYPPNVAGWPHNESWIDASHMAARVQTGRDAGWFVMSDEMDGSPVGAELARIDSPDRLAEALLRQFGLVEWSDATFQAVRRAADADGWTAHDQAFAAAFYSPEVTFS